MPLSIPAPHSQPLSDKASSGKTRHPSEWACTLVPSALTPLPLLLTSGHAGGGLRRGEDLPACAIQGWGFPSRDLHLHCGHRLSGEWRLMSWAPNTSSLSSHNTPGSWFSIILWHSQAHEVEVLDGPLAPRVRVVEVECHDHQAACLLKTLGCWRQMVAPSNKAEMASLCLGLAHPAALTCASG